MTQISPDRLCELTSEALERTAFVMVDQVDADEADAVSPTRFSRLKLTADAWTGSVVLGADNEFLREVASSLLGIDEDDVDDDEQGNDVLLELANIIAGSVSLELGGNKVHIGMGLPEVLPNFTPPATEPARLEGDGGYLCVWWALDTAAEAAA